MLHVLELFVSGHCPACPDARGQARRFAMSQPNVLVIERDVDDEPEAAARYGLVATPAIVIDGELVMYGVPSVDQLAARCRPSPGGACS